MPGRRIHKPRNWPTAIDLFSGCGAVTAGLKSARFKVIAAVDNDPIACKTYRRNHPAVHLIEDDITNVDPGSIKGKTLKDRSLDLMVVCAPCQPFSNHQRSTGEDSRVQFVLESIRFAAALNPRMILFENVPGLASQRFELLRTDLDKGLRAQGYSLGNPIRLDAADFGVPQRRGPVHHVG